MVLEVSLLNLLVFLSELHPNLLEIVSFLLISGQFGTDVLVFAPVC